MCALVIGVYKCVHVCVCVFVCTTTRFNGEVCEQVEEEGGGERERKGGEREGGREGEGKERGRGRERERGREEGEGREDTQQQCYQGTSNAKRFNLSKG